MMSTLLMTFVCDDPFQTDMPLRNLQLCNSLLYLLQMLSNNISFSQVYEGLEILHLDLATSYIQYYKFVITRASSCFISIQLHVPKFI